MTVPAPLDDATLMAFADGMLDSAEAARVRARIATDRQAQARVALFRGTRALLGAYDALAVPRAGDAWEIARAQRARRARTRLVETAVAACLCVALGLLSVLREILPVRIDGEAAFAPALAAALETTPAGGLAQLGADATLVPIETYATAQGVYCRSFALSETTREIGEGYACRLAPGRWRGMLPTAPAARGSGGAGAPASGYAPASGLPAAAVQLAATRGQLTRLSSDRAAALLEHHWTLPAASAAHP